LAKDFLCIIEQPFLRFSTVSESFVYFNATTGTGKSIQFLYLGVVRQPGRIYLSDICFRSLLNGFPVAAMIPARAELESNYSA
jgi:hypothetical protein